MAIDMKQNKPRRHFPLIWRAAGLLLIVLIAAVASTTLITRAARTGEDCLKVEDDSNPTVFIDPYAHRFVYLAPSTSVPVYLEPESDDTYLRSPDGKHLARFVASPDESQPQLVIDTAEPPVHDGNVTDVISWSPDSQWVVYISRAPDNTTYLAISDANGLHKQMTLLSTIQVDLAVDEWTSDGQYLSLRIGKNDAEHLTYWRIPELKRIVFGTAEEAYLNTCTTHNETNKSLHAAPIGHYFTCSASDNDKARIVVVGLDKSEIASFELPEAQVTTQWSSNGKYLAVTTFDMENFVHKRRLNVIRVDTLSMQDVDAAHQVVTCEFCASYPASEWSFDDKTLIYIRRSQYKANTLDVMLYEVDTNTYRYWLTVNAGKYSFDIHFITSRYNQTTIHMAYSKSTSDDDYKTQFLFVSNLSSFEVPPSNFAYEKHWSPDGSLLAVSFHNSTTDESYVEFFDKYGGIVDRVTLKQMNINMTNFGEHLTWTSCKPNV